MIEIKVVLKRFEFLQWAQFCGFLNRTDFCPTMQRSAAPGQQIKSGRCIKSLNQHLVLSCKIDPCCLHRIFFAKIVLLLYQYVFLFRKLSYFAPPPAQQNFLPQGQLRDDFFSWLKSFWLDFFPYFFIPIRSKEGGKRLLISTSSRDRDFCGDPVPKVLL